MYKTPEEMQVAIDAYFADCDAKEKPYTITGLALALGFTTRLALINYEGKPGFVNTVKRAKLRVEACYEGRLHESAATGAIFALKNFEWTDKSQQELTGANGGPIKTEVTVPAEDKEILKRFYETNKDVL